MRPVLLFVLASIAARAEGPKLVLDAPRVQSLLPGLAAKGYGKKVEVKARLEGDPDEPAEYYCLDEVWEWGDGTESFHENDCDPYEDGFEIERQFGETHYFRPGHYEITLRLTRGDETILKGVIDVQIR